MDELRGVLGSLSTCLMLAQEGLPTLALTQPDFVQPLKKGVFARKRKTAMPAKSLTDSTPSQRRPDDRIRVTANVEPTCLRTISAFGLYETISRPAVFVRVVLIA